MVREYDVREDHDGGRTLDLEARRAELDAAAERASAALPGDQRVEVADVDPVTGGANRVVVVGATPHDDDFVRRAVDHVQRIGDVLGLAPGQPPEYRPDPVPQVTSSGAVVVHLEQQVEGIGVYDAAETVRFAADGRLLEVAGRSRRLPAGTRLDPTPTVRPAEALAIAVRFLAEADAEPEEDPFGQPLRLPELDVTSFEPQHVTGPADQPDRACVFRAEQLAESVTVRLLWFPVGDELRLAWVTVLTLPGGAQFRVVVDAHDGAVLLSRPLVLGLLGEATIRLRGGGEPAEDVALPLPLDRYPVPAPDDLPAGFPDDWLLDASTDGANVRALRVDTEAPATGEIDGDVVRFAPQDPVDDLVVHLFAYNGLAHDLLYLVGFREADGNFQRDDLGRGGRASDAVVALVHPGPVFGTANMRVPVDGIPPQMNMGLVESTGRHTALDVDVVVHEYVHGLTIRLVGGPLNERSLDAIQSGGMGEGWSDYVACTLNDRVTVGAWVVDRPDGIRGAAYTDDYPSSFADLGTGRFTRVHAIGELWCAALLAMNRRVGSAVGLQLVVDGLKLAPANPSFLDARDAILLAAEQLAEARALPAEERSVLVGGAWEAFARFGMGPAARSDGPTLNGVVADFEVPTPEAPPTPTPPPGEPDVAIGSAEPDLTIPDDDPTGVSSTIRLDAPGDVTGLEVRVDIDHTYRGDLVVVLTAPDGRGAILHDRTGGSADDLDAAWDSDDVPALAVLLDGPGAGDWTLTVADRAGLDVGTLRAWQVRARLAGATSGA